MAMRFGMWLRGIVVLLSAQFLLGIWVDLYGSFPSTTNLGRAMMYTGDPALSVHMVLAVLLVILAFVLAVGSFSAGAPARLRWVALGGLLAVLWAYESGLQFVLSGFGNNLDSFSMAAAFVVAMVLYGIAQGLVATSSPAPRPGPGVTGPA
jgi:hypothetical protein